MCKWNEAVRNRKVTTCNTLKGTIKQLTENVTVCDY
jgi:hypothetical protein